MFRTPIEGFEPKFQINHKDKLLTLGSCFAEEIGSRLLSQKFDIQVNPFGTIFNPLSVFELLELTLEPSLSLETAIVKRDETYYNYKFHSSFRDSKPETLLQSISNKLELVKAHLLKSKVIFITFGTAWVYETKADEMLVANCHKLPQKQFNKRMLNLEEIVSAFFSLKETIQPINPDLQIVLTVSPVRHTKETLSLNSVSKSVLRLACHYLSDMSEDVHYFPSYEIMMDDLRDYRFYEKDMIHPNEQAVDYIWSAFSKSFFSKTTQQTIIEWEKLDRALKHKPFNSENKKHKEFLKKTLTRLQNLSSQLNVEEEIKNVQSQLKHG